MEDNTLQSLTGTTPTGSEARAKRADKPDSDAFTSCLDDATKSKDASGKSNLQLIDDDKKKDTKKEAQQQERAAAAQVKATKEAVSKLSPAMAKLMHQNPDTMSLAEKQAMRLGEFSREGEVKQSATQQNRAAQVAQGMGQIPAQAIEKATNRNGNNAPKAGPTENKGQKFALSEDKDAKETRSKQQIAQEHRSPHQPNLDHLLANEARATEKLSKADQVKAMEHRQNVLDQIIKHVEVKNFQNRTELSLRLNPEYLGELKINMVHTKDGGVTTRIQTSSRVTRQLLHDAKEELTAQAEGKGIRLGKIDVTLVDQVS